MRYGAARYALGPFRVWAVTRRLGVCNILSDRSLPNKSSKDMAFPHPKSGKSKYRNGNKPNHGGVVWKFFKRTINITDDRNAEDEVNQAWGPYSSFNPFPLRICL